MTAAWFLGAGQGVPQDENVVRSTIQPIRTDPEFAEDVAPPDFNEFETDESPQLTGLANRMVAGDVTDSVKTAPLNAGLATMNHNAVIDNQVATSGTAAAREMAGQSGHGTMEYQNSLSPEIRDGAAFGNDYFRALTSPIMEGAGEYMTATQVDNWASQVSQAFANDASRDAYQATQYKQFMEGFI